jgi:hypothetical protein
MPTQFLSSDHTLTRKAARYEVGMLADQLTPSGALTDAFGRLRTSTPFTLFDSQHRYVENDKWSTVTANGGTSVHVPVESVMNMSVTSTTNSEVVRETRRVMAYQPGKSLLIMTTFAMATPVANLRQRVGYFSTTNGIYLENDGAYNWIVLRSASLNTELRIRQDAWNGDKFDGSGYSERTLDPSKTQIFWMDIEWLGVGDVRCGFVVNGKPVLAHTFHNDNVRTTTYMTTACLPLRYEIKNLGSASGTMKQICSTVLSEGGYEEITKQWAATRTTAIASVSVATGWAPVVSIQLASGRTDGIVIPAQIHIVGTGNGIIYEFALIRNATISSGQWVTHSSSGGGVEYNVTSTSMSGGAVEDSGIFASSNQSNALINIEIARRFEQQLGRDQSGTSDTITLAARHLAGSGSVYGTLNWNSVV